MEQKRISVPALTPFAREYISGSKQAGGFFDYDPFSQQSFQQRSEEVRTRMFKRKELAGIIRNYMAPHHVTVQTEHSLQKLEDPESVVVIGGQQAGLLTGPLYSIHKIISILHLAREQEEQLGIPVVPVFWIAGEDHDLLEINHVFVEKNGSMQKIGYPERFVKKQAASSTVYDQEQMLGWVASVFACLKETHYTNQLLHDVKKAVKASRTFTDFFAFLTGSFFAKHGLLLIDAADPELRKLEAPFFKRLIVESGPIAEAVHSTQQDLEQAGFTPAIEMSGQPANLFLIEEEERHLLEREGALFISKSGRSYTEGDLLQLLETSPESFSNNVVTRPLMQEWLFPTLAFIAGPGEIAYWAELKGAFEYIGLTMPLIMPRLNITIVDRTVAEIVSEIGTPIETAVQQGVQNEKSAYMDSIRDHHLDELVAHMKQDLMASYEKIEARAAELHNGLAPIVEKNKQYHERQIELLLQKSDAVLKQTHDAALRRFDRVQVALRPDGLQERVWNVYPFLNVYGPSFIDDLLNQPYKHDGGHYLLYV
ncbi:bacillithiol biosynthesis cysteine-adding enzyme BshC [Domibacillus indicus]|uniref:bacillithiol biosynthesis cysteine-adding enzyme BshC n=1 Tax=Domibacillus indicus TaxID=1437523 RepID=UPI00203A4FAD|nr:bacillithiol biosynthesis cysteine-adding enzyme BshC [Domibacillus indicus]MCM3787663.1 bacillithiol biosynthesis cysteine-adding enzyme BshC [Domibacillus indicus]